MKLLCLILMTMFLTGRRTFAADIQTTIVKHCNVSHSLCLEIESERADLSQFQPVVVLKNPTVKEFEIGHKTKTIKASKVTVNMMTNEIVVTEFDQQQVIETRFKMDSLQRESFRTVL